MPNTPYNLTTNVTLESALPLDSDITSALQQATLLISGKLQQFADDSAFGDKIQVAFGTAVNTDELQSQWQAGDLTGFPIMEIVAGNDLNGANGAYAIVNNRIYLSYEFLSQNQGNLGAIVALLLEEYGHYVDGLLNSTDAPGDEGAIFASLVLGESLSEEALAYMKAEDDAGVISIGGVSIAVERATTTEPSLVADINSTSFGSNPSNFIKIGDILYFTANDDVNGIELWRANPATGVVSLLDIYPGSNTSSVSNLTDVNGTLYFTAFNGINGTELYRIDNTTGNPVLIDINSGSGYSWPSNLTNVNGTLYFTANNGSNGTELYRIDNATGNPALIDIVSGSSSSSPQNLLNANGVLYFTASNSANGRELWKVEPTTGNPVFLKDIYVGSNGSNPGNLTYSNGKLYFTADNYSQGIELWQTDGTPEGTALVKDINATTLGSSPSNFIKIGDILYFTANDDVNGIELWRANPATGVVSLLDIYPGSNTSSVSNLTDVNGTLYFTANNGTNGTELYRIDNTTGNPVLIDIRLGLSSSSPSNLTNVNGTLYFTANNGSNGTELYRIDNATGNPALIDIVSGSSSSSPQNLTNINGVLYFSASNSAAGRELWKVDPANNLPILVSDIRPGSTGSDPTNLIFGGGTVYFTANNGTNGIELYRVDPTTGNIVLLDINTGSGSSNPRNLIDINGTLYFTATNSLNTERFYKIDPTTGQPVQLSVPNLRNDDAGYLDQFTRVGDRLYFRNSNWNNEFTIYRPLYTIDPATGNVVQVAGTQYVEYLTNVNGTLYLQAYNSATGTELYRINNTTGNAVLIDVVTGSGSSSPQNFINVNGTVFFTANNSANGTELWKLDASGNPVLVKDIRTGSNSSSPSRLFAIGNTLYLTADNGINGVELWVSDGTSAGTVLAKDINERSPSSNPRNLIDINGTLYFTANNGVNGERFYKIDPTTGQPVLLSVPNLRNDDAGYLDQFTRVGDRLYFRNSYYDNTFTIYRPLYTIDPATGNVVQVAGTQYVEYLTNVNGTLYFQGYNSASGYELYRINNTTGNAVLIDVVTGSGSSSPQNFTNVNGTVFFTANNSANGTELWKLDASGNPVLVKDIRTGSNSSSPSRLFAIGNTLYLTADNGINGVELWVSDGTSAGTVLAKDINERSPSSNPRNLIDINGTLYFTANNGVNGERFYKIDPTTGQPVLLSVPNLRNDDAGYLDQFTRVGDRLYFRNSNWNNEFTIYRPLYTIDPATGNVVQVSGTQYVEYLTNVNGTLYFQAYNSATGSELYRINNTTGNAVLIDVVTGSGSSSPQNFTNVNGTVFFTANNSANGTELWKLDASGNPVLVKDIGTGSNSSSPTTLYAVGNVLYFTADDGVNGRELWRSDGTAQGTVPLEIYIGSSTPNVSNLIDLGGVLYFTANNPTYGTELWRINSTTGNPEVVDVHSGASSSSPANLTNVNGTLYFTATTSATGTELYRINNTTGNPVLIDINSAGSGSSSPSNLTNVNGILYFTATTSATGTELYRIDNATSNPALIDIVSGSSSSSPYNLLNANGVLYFTAYYNNTTGWELWKLDPTTGNPVFLKDIYVGSNGSNPGNLTYSNGKLYFTADNYSQGIELWQTDGTPEGTALVKDINATTLGSSPSNFIKIGDILYFTANDDVNGTELWRANPATGVVSLLDIYPGSNTSSVSNLTDVNGTLYFTAFNGTNGIELYRIDNTTGNPVLIDINSGSGSSSPSNLTNVNGTLYFQASTPTSGSELWRIDPATGTPSVVDVVSGSGSSNPYNLLNANGVLYFTAYNNTTGWELWKVDPTTGNPVFLKDIYVGSNSSNPGNLTYSNGKLYFTADNGVNGVELWTVNVDQITTIGVVQKTGDEDQVIPFAANDFASVFNSGSGVPLAKIKIINLPSNGLLKLNNSPVAVDQEIAVVNLGNLTFTPNTNYNGIAGFTWNGSDGTNYALNPSTVALTINSINDVPTVANPITDTSIFSNRSSNFTISANTFQDSDVGDSLTYSATLADGSTLPSWLTFNDRTFSGNPSAAQAGQYDLKVIATDQSGASTSDSFVLSVVNSAPTNITLNNSTVPENSANNTVIGLLSASDNNTNDTHTFTLINNAGGRFAIVNNQLVVADGSLLDYETNTQHTIRVKATDNTGLSYENNLTISISNVTDDTAPDLIVSNASVPATGTVGKSIEVSWTVQNQGTSAAPTDWYDRIYLSNDAIFDANADTYITQELISTQTPLAAGASYSITRNINLPNFATGNRYLIFVADGSGGQGETNETNNTRAVAINLNAPDLIVSEITAPVESLSGQPIEINWTVKNQGAATAEGTWYDYVYLVNTATSATQYVGIFEYSGSLAAGASLNRTQSYGVPLSLTGNYRVVVTTDFYGQLAEGTQNESNNTTTDDRPISLQLAPVPNLQVTGVTAPSTAFSSQETVVQWTVKNVGTGATNAPVWYDRVYLSLDTTYDNTDTYLGEAVNPSYLNPNDSYSNSLTVTLPRGIDGNYYFLVQADVYNYVTEVGNEGDNWGSGGPTDVNLTPPPDLQVTAVNAPNGAFSGQPMNLSWTVTNAGTGRTLETAWYDRVFMSADATLDAGDRNLGTFYHSGALNAGANYTGSATVNLPTGVAGSFFFFVQSDIYNNVYEHVFENNNSGYDTTATNITLTPPPDLEFESLTIPNNARSGSSLSINYRVTNFGATETPNYYWTDTFYLSSDNQLNTATDINLGSVGQYGILYPGDGYDRTANFALPNTLTGTYYVFGVTDSGDQVFELNNVNNVTQSINQVQIVSQPADLVVTNATIPTTGEAGKAISVQWTVKNQGTGDTIVNSWSDRLVVSNDEVLGDADDLTLASFTRTGLLAPNGTYSRTESVILPFTLEGNYQLFVVTDSANSVYEGSNEGNNASSAFPLTISRDTPDLQVTSITLPNTVTPGQPLTLNWTVANLGVGRTNSNYWYDQVYLSLDKNVSGDDINLGSVYRSGALEPSASYSATGTFSLPVNLNGSYYVLVQTDRDNNVIEGAFENNNVLASDSTSGGGSGTGTLPITPAPSADLAVTAVDAPEQGIAGQSLSLTWTVVNNDANTGQSWYDAVYLSRDQVFDRNSDVYLGYRNHTGGLNAGDSYTATQSFNIPRGLGGRFYAFVVTDGGNAVYERLGEINNVNYDGFSTEIIIPPPSDLVVTNIATPSSGIPGQNISINYTVQNQGTDTAYGSWKDSVYLSQDTQWDVSDALVGQVNHSGDIASGASYTGVLNGVVPGVNLGNFYVIVRSDILNQVSEVNEGNNVGVSSSKITLDVEELGLETPDTGNLGQGQSVYYRFDAQVGQAIRLSFDSSNNQSFNELYVSYGKMPSRGQFDLTTTQPFNADPEIVIPIEKTGTYYVLAYGDQVSGSPSYQILAQDIPFSITKVNTDTIGNFGEATLEIYGAKFIEGTTFQLLASDGSVIEAEQVYLENSTLAYVTFDLFDDPIGLYDLKAKHSDGSSVILADSITVQTATGYDLNSNITGPEEVRPGRNYIFNVNYGNEGDTDAIAPLLIIESVTNTQVGTTLKGLSSSGPLHLLGVSNEGPQGILRPGDLNTLPIYFNSSTDPVNFSVRTYSADNNTPVDWNSFEASIRPSGLTDTQWDSFIRNIASQVRTYGEYVLLLNKMSAIVSPENEPIYDVNELFGKIYQQNANYSPSVSFKGTLTDINTGNSISQGLIILERINTSNPVRRSFFTDDLGDFELTGLDAGSYQLRVAGSLDEPINITVNLSATPQILNLEVDYVPPRDLLRDLPPSQEKPVLTVASDDSRHVLVVQNGSIAYATYDEITAQWTTPITIPQAQGNRIQLLAVVDPVDSSSPILMAVWVDNNDNFNYAIARKIGDSYQWGNGNLIPSSAQPATNQLPFMRLQGQDNGTPAISWVVFGDSDTGNQEYLTTWDGITWTNISKADSSVSSLEVETITFQEINILNDSSQPTPYPPDQLGSLDYYDFRYKDFQRRNPGQEPPDYYKEYGEKYVSRFTNETAKKLSPEGQAWLEKTRENLQRAIEDRLNAAPGAFAELERNTDAFRDFAYETHPDAYWDAGLKDLPIKDLLEIGSTPDFKDLLTPEGLEQVAEIAERYVKDKAQQLEDKLNDLVNKIGDGTGDIVEGIGDILDGLNNIADGIGDLLDGKLEPPNDFNDIDQILDGIDDLVDGIGDIVDGISDLADAAGDIVEGLKDLVDSIDDAIGDIGDFIGDKLKDGISDIADWIDNTADDIGDTVNDLIDDFKCYLFGDCDDDDDNDDDDYDPDVIRPRDPNDILGPKGFGDEQWINTNERFGYTIRFENAATASAPAQEVVITQQLDSDLDWRTFRVDDYGWSGNTYELAGDRAFHQGRIDLTETKGFYVDVFVSIETTTGIATWRISTVDPETGEAPLDAQKGFLPTNDENGVGEGFVTYSIKTKNTVQTADVIDATARIVFDTEEPIDTPPIFNTLDVTKPTSQVDTLPTTTDNPEFTVKWTGTDIGSALATYTIYVSDNGGNYTVWLNNTELTEATYTGTAGHTYSFYSVAVDNTGNTEAAPTTADATIQIGGAVNQPPQISVNTGLTLNEGANSAISNSLLAVTDPDNTSDQLTFTISTIPTNGNLQRNGVTLAVNNTFTQADINSGLLSYIHNGGETTSDSFSFTVADGAGGNINVTSFVITVNPVDDAPTVLNPITDVNVAEDAENSVINLSNVFTDIDNDPTSIVKSVFANDNPGLVTATIVNNQLTLDYQDNQSGTANLTIRGTSNGKTVDDTFIVTVNPVDDAPTVLNPITDVNVAEDAENSVINLSNVFTDIDNDPTSIVKSVFANDNPGLVTATIVNNQLTLDYQNNQSGIANITIRGTSNGKTVDDTFLVTVNPVDDAPTVINPITDVNVNEDAANTVIDLTNIFTDIDNDPTSIVKSVFVNNNPGLVTATIVDNQLTLDYQNNQSGTANLTIRGTSNGKTVDNTFLVTVNPVDDAPTVINPITDVNVNEDAANTVIDLTNIFTDIDNEPTSIVKSVFVNNNPGLVTATIVDNQLTLDYQNNQSGIANITIRGTSNGKTVDNSFTITVASVNDAPTLQQEIANQTATENQPFSFTIPANTFTDIDGDNLTYTLATGTVLPSGITFDSATRTFSGTPSDTASGTYNLTVIASDSAGEKANDSFSLNVLNAVNGSTSSETVNGTSGDDHINAGAGNDSVNGGEGNDILDGGIGNDRLAGGPGDDTYIVDSSRDVAIENAGQGQDTIKSSVNYTLTVNIENITLTGNANIDGTGNNLDNVITGNSGNNLLKGLDGNDTLLGGAGNDTLIGGKGNDILTGGDGSDSFLFGSGAIFNSSDFGVDNISDFTKGSDKIILSKTSFNALVSTVGNSLQAAEFATINEAANELNLVGSSNAKIVYNLATGNLFYNQNGATTGLGNGALFVTLNSIPQLNENDILIQA